MPAYLTSWGLTPFGRRPEGLVELLRHAAAEAVERAPRSSRPEAVVVGTMTGGSLGRTEGIVPRLLNALGSTQLPGWRCEAASATGAAAFQMGRELVDGGRYRNVLVVAGEKMTDRPIGEVTTDLARSLSEHEFRQGATMPSMAALVSQEYCRHFGLPWERIGTVTVRNRARAALNPLAHLRSPVTLEEVNASRPVSSPLRLLHVSPVSDGAAAVLLTREPAPVRVVGVGQASDVVEVLARTPGPGFQATREAARRAYAEARITPEQVGVAEVHDAFAPFQLMDVEDLGFCPPGQGLAWTEAGQGDVDGRCPVNPSGGLLGRGHPVGASGLAQIVEIARQIVDAAGPYQIPGRPRIGLAQSVGGLGSQNFVTVLSQGGAL